MLLRFIKYHLYVDDPMGAVDSDKEVVILRKQIQEIFSMMKIKITKWSSNSVALLKTIPSEELPPYEDIEDKISKQKEEDPDNITFSDPEVMSKTAKCMGMSWTTNTYGLRYNSYKDLSELEGKSLK